MWVFTTDGFYSAVAHRSEPNTIIVRSRVREDAERLADRLLVEVEVQHTPQADYPWRLFVSRPVFARYLAEQVETMEYPNFKATISDPKRSAVYHGVWAELIGLQVEDE